MSKKRLVLAGQAYRSGDLGAVLKLLDEDVIDRAADEATADHLRLVRATAQHRLGDSRAALATLARVSPRQPPDGTVCRLAAVCHLALGAPAAAAPFLGELARQGEPDACRPHQLAEVHRAVAALRSGRATEAVEILVAVDLRTMQDAATQYAGWIALIRATLAAGQPERVPERFALVAGRGGDHTANLIAAEAAITRLDAEAAERHIRAARPGSDAWQLLWRLCRSLFAAGRFAEVAGRFAHVGGIPGLDSRGRGMVVLAAHALARAGQADTGWALMEQLADRFPDDEGLAYHAVLHASVHGKAAAGVRFVGRLRHDRDLFLLLRAAAALHQERFAEVCGGLTPAVIGARPSEGEREALRVVAALAAARMGNPEMADSHLRAAHEDAGPAPARSARRFLSGYVALALARHSEAVDLLAGTPLACRAALERARDRADAGDHEGALSDLDTAEKDPPQAGAASEARIWVRTLQAREEISRGEFHAARRLLAGLPREGSAAAREVLRLDDRIAVRGTVRHARDGDPALVAETLWSLHDASPVPLPSEQDRARRCVLAYLAAALWVRAMATSKGGTTADVAKALEVAVRAAPEFAPASGLLGSLLHLQGQRTRALELLGAAARQGLTSRLIREALSEEFLRLGRLLEAKRLFFERLYRDGESAALRRGLTEVLRREGRSLFDLEAAADGGGDGAEDGDPPRDRAGEASALPERDPFAGTAPERRLFLLVHHLEALVPSARERREELVTLIRALKRLAVAADTAGFAELEPRALQLLSGGR
jgi:tetratricopeptide (TPR) repeat protein